MVAILSILLPLATIMVVLRFYSRKYHGDKVGIDDWVILLGLVSSRARDRLSEGQL
jgi:hypothetical protein